MLTTEKEKELEDDIIQELFRNKNIRLKELASRLKTDRKIIRNICRKIEKKGRGIFRATFFTEKYNDGKTEGYLLKILTK